jgi:sec-independent protein translocase protein TatB
MFDAGLFEMLVIFTLGLLVLGPERLPRVAKFIGRWVGQARRAVTKLNNEIERELALDEIRRIQRESEQAIRKELDDTVDAVNPGARTPPQAPSPAEASPEQPTIGGGSAEPASSSAPAAGADDAADGDDVAGAGKANDAPGAAADDADRERDAARH